MELCARAETSYRDSKGDGKVSAGLIRRNTALRDRLARRGFTLIERMFVVCIVGILLSLLIPSFRRARQAVQLAACCTNLKAWGVAVNMCAVDNQGRFPWARSLRESVLFQPGTHRQMLVSRQPAGGNRKRPASSRYWGCCYGDCISPTLQAPCIAHLNSGPRPQHAELLGPYWGSPSWGGMWWKDKSPGRVLSP